jgi:hypothetical protein
MSLLDKVMGKAKQAAGPIGQIVPMGQDNEGIIVLSKQERGTLLGKLEKLNQNGIRRLRAKLVKWTMIRNYLGGTDHATDRGTRITAAQRLLGHTSDTGNVDEEPYVNNVMLRIHMSNMQRLGRFMPEIDVDPNENTLEDKKASKKCKIFLTDLLDRQKYKSRLRRKMDRTIATAGSCYLKVTMDPYSGQGESLPKLDEFGKQIGWEDDPEYEGEVVLGAPHPKNIVLPAHAVDLDDADWLIENNIRTTEYVLRRYHETVSPEMINTKDIEWWRLGNEAGRDDKEGVKDDNLCFVKEIWHRRSIEFPRGAHVIWCGSHILKCTTLDDFYPDLPYYKAEFIYDDEDPDGDTPYWHMIPMQNALNKVEADVKRHTIMMCKPKWQMHAETTLSDPDGITNETAQILRWTGTQSPGIITAPELPETVFTWRNMLQDEMMSLGAAHDIAPKPGRSGTAIAYEQEQDDTTLAPTIWSMGVMHEDALSFAAKLCSQYYLKPRRFGMRGKDGRLQSAVFSGEDLKGNFKVHVNMQSGLPANKIARQQLIVQLVNQQIITPQQAQQFFEFGQLDEATHRIVVMFEAAQRIVENMEDGNPYLQMPAMPFHDYPVVMNELRTAMQSDYFDWPPEIQQQFQDAMLDVMKKMQPAVPPPMPGAPGANGPGKPGLQPPAQPPVVPPGVPGMQGQGPGQQPLGPPTGLFEIPGMGEEPRPAPQLKAGV